MFNDPYVYKNRRIQAHEWQTELELCKLMHRPPRAFLHDPPYYPWLPPTPKVPLVNFDLGFNKGQH